MGDASTRRRRRAFVVDRWSHSGLAPVLLALCAGGCAWAYRPGTLLEERAGAEVRTAGCIDWRVSLREEPDLLVPPHWTVLRVEAGNRCEEPVRIDLSRARVVALREGRDRVTLRLFDPRREIRPATLDGAQLDERIAFEPPDGTGASIVCVSLAAVAPAPHAPGDEPCLRALAPAGPSTVDGDVGVLTPLGRGGASPARVVTSVALRSVLAPSSGSMLGLEADIATRRTR